MRLYVANCTNQHQDFIYRLPEAPGTRLQRIEIGQQTVLSGDLNQLQIDAIIEQHRPYGLVEVSEIDRTKAFIGLCYSVDRPIKVDKIRTAMEINTGVLNARGEQIRREAAVATSNTLEESAPLKALEMEVVEQPSKDRDATFSQGLRVQRQNAEGPQPPVQTGRRRRAA